jgi:hypothetical protein
MSNDFFKGIKQWEFQKGDLQFKLPVFYYDTTSITAIYTADTKKVKALLPLAEMNPVELFPGKCLIAFTGFEYRKTDIDPYNEFAITFLISYDKVQIPGITAMWQMARRCISGYVWQLPVTTEIARYGGVELYGFPKFIADITFEKNDSHITCHVAENDQQILSLTGKILPTATEKITQYTTYSVIDDIPLKTNVYINPAEFAQTRERNAASIELGDHSICHTLKDIGLSATPITYQYSPFNQAILFAGRNLTDI